MDERPEGRLLDEEAGMNRSITLAAVCAAALGVPGCAALGALGQGLAAPTFEVAAERPAELVLLPPSATHPAGGAAVRLWARVHNPNAFGLTLASIAGNLFLEGRHAADVSFPLGLPLAPARDTVFPLDIGIGFANVPGLAEVALRAAGGQAIAYRLNGTFAVDAGPLGRPSFGPRDLLQGHLQPRR
jgi:hypothetical protein